MSEQSYLRDVHSQSGLGKKRRLYLKLFDQMPDVFGQSILDVGAGMPVFLEKTKFAKKTALDIDDYYREQFDALGIAFVKADLDREELSDIGPFDTAICSDVFEHLTQPLKALQSIKAVMTPGGVLLSHVPNEYRLKKTISIMLSRSEGMYYHTNMNEWDDPHFRRFTDRGFKRFLAQEFAHNLRLNPLSPSSQEKLLNGLGITAPLALTAGPTYFSTDDASKAAALKAFAGKRQCFM